MAKGKRPHKHSEIYLAQRKRVANKERQLAHRIKNLSPETQEFIREACPIGREKELGKGKVNPKRPKTDRVKAREAAKKAVSSSH